MTKDRPAWNASPPQQCFSLPCTQNNNVSGVPNLSHPAFSLDLDPYDFFFLFPKTDKIRGRRFESPEVAVAAYEELLHNVSKDEWRTAYSKWFDRMEHCIQCQGEYFEKI